MHGGGDASKQPFYYHLDPIMNSKFRPYVGAGLGYVQEIDIDLKNVGGVETSYSQDGEIAYQLIAGTSYGLTENWDLTADVRYMRVDSINLKREAGGNRGCCLQVLTSINWLSKIEISILVSRFLHSITTSCVAFEKLE
jgi:hypothetical protein